MWYLNACRGYFSGLLNNENNRTYEIFKETCRYLIREDLQETPSHILKNVLQIIRIVVAVV
jgi:hypothetical protein